ncbi:MAG: trypsin-like peptidase domain-containing protein [Planctomycetes bacterium]|nr:trypsin-like peptidase domain-containing protein [Planctomycetota bacterium]
MLPIYPFFAALAFAACALAGGVPGREPPPGFPDIVARVRCGIGVVGTLNPANHPALEFLASGFFIDARGRFLTANHVLEAAAERKRLGDLRVFLPSDPNRDGHPATVLARDARHDVALLDVKGGHYVPLELGDSARVREGQAIALTGFPFGFFLGLHPTTCVGIVSGISPIAIPAASSKLLDADTIEALRNPFNVFQLDATAHPGHSGGPLFDPANGKVLGIVNSGFIRKIKEKVISTGITYAIPIHLAKPLLDDALKPRPAPLPIAPR